MDRFVDFLKYLLTPAGTGVVVFFLAEKLPRFKDWFGKLLPDEKQLVVFGLCVGLPLVGTEVGMLFGYFPADVDMLYQAVKVGVEAFGASTLLHVGNNVVKRLNARSS